MEKSEKIFFVAAVRAAASSGGGKGAVAVLGSSTCQGQVFVLGFGESVAWLRVGGFSEEVPEPGRSVRRLQTGPAPEDDFGLPVFERALQATSQDPHVSRWPIQ